jgi:hypothetical protein
MLKQLFLLPAVVVLLTGLSACSGQEKTGEATEEHKQAAPMQGITVALDCMDIGGGNEDFPQRQVSLRLGTVSTTLDTIAACQLIERQDYARYGIPAEAVAACGGWWAGSGDYFYALIDKGDEIVVMRAMEDEANPAGGYNYEEVSRKKIQ